MNARNTAAPSVYTDEVIRNFAELRLTNSEIWDGVKVTLPETELARVDEVMLIVESEKAALVIAKVLIEGTETAVEFIQSANETARLMETTIKGELKNKQGQGSSMHFVRQAVFPTRYGALRLYLSTENAPKA